VLRTTRVVAVTAVTATALAAFAAPSSAARAGSTPTPTTKDPAAAAAGYLARHLQGKRHDHYTVTFSGTVYPNYGETADAVLSMNAAKVAGAAAGRAARYLKRHVRAYAKGSPTYYPGSLAKLMLVAVAEHADIRAFGGVDLLGKLRQAEGAGDAVPGEFQQNPGFPGGTSYVVSQALPVLALALAPGAPHQPDAAAVSFLAGQQCGNGGFQSTIRTDTSTTCGAEDVDSTGYAVQALLAAGAKAAAERGLAWLRNARNADGGYGSPSNANSTALAVEALLAGHQRADAGLRWLRGHQVGCAGPRGHRGAVKFQKTYDGSALLATSQAGAALARTPLAWIDRAGSRRAAPITDCTTG
jgi:hypothetical protein